MKVRLLAILIVAFIIACKEHRMIKTAPGESSLLWEVSGNGLKAPSYFLGTMHMMCAEDAVLSVNTKKIIKEVEQVYLEADLDNVGELISGAFSLKMANDTSLSDLLNDEDYQKVKSFLEKHQSHLPFSILEHQQPLMLSSSLYELFLPCETKNGIDIRILELAAELKKDTKGLETVAFQASLFDSIPYKEQAKELVRTIDSIGKYEKLLKDMVAVYNTQDIEKLHTMVTHEEAGISAYTDLLLYKRNKNWVAQFSKIASEKRTLFAVGAGHLGGGEGVIKLLRKQGYTLRPLEN
jgi:uncharacterized protein YbaP (TraB family)